MTTKKTKLRLSDLAPKPYRLNLVHPDHGDTGAYVDLMPAQSNAYFLKLIKLAKTAEDATPEEQIHASAELSATAILGWDHEFFGMEFTTDAATELLSQVENFWIRDAISVALAERGNFFKKR